MSEKKGELLNGAPLLILVRAGGPNRLPYFLARIHELDVVGTPDRFIVLRSVS